MLAIAVAYGDISIGGCVRVKHPDIQEGSLKSTSPKAIHCNVKPCSIDCVGSNTIQDLTSKWLQFRLYLDIMTNFGQQFCCYVTYFIVITTM